MTENEDLKAKMREALAKKNAGHDAGVGDENHHKEKGVPQARGRQGGSREFRRKAGG